MDTSVKTPTWRRIFAFFIDIIALGIVGLILGTFLYKYFSLLGYYGRLIGLIIAVAYFGILNSKVGKGQTLGKKFLKIKVVDAENEFISLKKSLLRAFVLYFPITMSGFFIPLFFVNGFLGTLLVDILIALFFITAYLLFFNSPAKRVIHDLIVESYVIRKIAEGPSQDNVFNKRHYVVMGIISLFIILFSGLTSVVANSMGMGILLETGRKIQSEYDVAITGFSFNYRKSFNTGETTGMVVIGVRTSNIENMELAQGIAQTTYNSIPIINNFDVIYVTLIKGYDIGIASGFRNQTYNFPIKKSKA